ncbi:MAG: hypothetical protein SCARUB_01616 [Candidatus Scalindua rubra]|uniref:PIN domain-containing protein n=1 Tax=Candidatus Scalindua rubra TaxID=1872076 RepID=A0A1E3XC69_9BACT|nr:MAG: hypothetical protein SCARUB_01616 [Candidatus Scalindua rubra]
MKRILIDTNVYASFKRNESVAVNELRKAEYIGINIIVLGEILSGFKGGIKEKQNKEELNLFLDSPRVHLVQIDDDPIPPPGWTGCTIPPPGGQVAQFIPSLLQALSNLDFVEKVDFQTDVLVFKGRAILKKNRFLQVYFNELTDTTAFALIEKEKRLWRIDYDNIRGWHIRPMKEPEAQHETPPKNIE